jgi:hypothetical protein
MGGAIQAVAKLDVVREVVGAICLGRLRAEPAGMFE